MTDLTNTDEPTKSSLDQALSQRNKGYALLQKMGWKAGQGLGSKKEGKGDDGLNPKGASDGACD